ncbi:MAG: ATP F0F1 synthase subunit B, partial [Halocynthiibacter sp.]
MKKLSIIFAALIASPAFATPEKFLTLKNPEFVVLIGFILFVALLVYLKVPGLLGGMLDKRAESIRSELDEARALREEAQTLLASYGRKQEEMNEQAVRIVEAAKAEAETAAAAAHEELKATIARRLLAAEDQIASAQTAAIRNVRDRAAGIAVAAAAEVIAGNMTAAAHGKRVQALCGAKNHMVV